MTTRTPLWRGALGLALLALLAGVPALAQAGKQPDPPADYGPEKDVESLLPSGIQEALLGPVITGALAATDPTFHRPLDSSNVSTTCSASWSLSGVGTATYYDVHAFQVTDGTPISIEVVTGGTTLGDSFLAVYCNPFNPAAPLANGVVNDDDAGAGLLSAILPGDNVTLTPGNTYYLVVTSFSNGATGTYTINTSDNIILPGSPPSPVAAGATLGTESCGPANNAVDPGELVTMSFCVLNNGGAATTALVGTLQATGGVENPSWPATYGAIAPAATVCRNFAFNADLAASCGGTITATLALQDGATAYPSATYTIPLGAPGAPVTQPFTNPGAITIPATGVPGLATPYPSTIAVAGLTGAVTKVTVTLTGYSHVWPDDTDVVLVGPTGAALVLMADVGGSGTASNVTLTLDDAAAALLPDSTDPVSGTFRPTNYTPVDLFPAPGPAVFQNPATTGTATFASVFNGLNPNGTWSLFVLDDTSIDGGSIAGGWTLAITTQGAATCCTQACVVSPVPPVTVNNEPGLCSAVAFYPQPPLVTGICGLVSCTPPPGSVFPVGATPVTCDPEAAGANVTTTVTVVDIEIPVVTCPADVSTTVTLTMGGGVVTWPDPTATDNCGIAALGCEPPSGSFLPIGDTAVTCTATDPSGNAGTCGLTASVLAQSVMEIPTLAPAGLAGLALLLAGGAVAFLRRRRA